MSTRRRPRSQPDALSARAGRVAVPASPPAGRRSGDGDTATVPVPASAGFAHRNLPLLLLQAREGVMARFRPILNAHGITEQQWRIVRALLEQGPLEPRQIGEVCRISSPSLAGVLARMDDLGLVQRARMANDQRRVLVQLTDRSRTMAAAMAPQIEAAYAAIEAHIGVGFIGGFYRTLDELIGLLEGLPPPDAPPEPD